MQAILLLAHKGLDYIENFLKQFDGRFNIYIHQDIKNPLTDKEIEYLYKTYSNIKSIKSEVDCKYSDISIINAEIVLIKEAIKDKENTYLHLMSEQCYICRDLDYFYDFFENNTTQYIWINEMLSTTDDLGYPNSWRVINNKYHYFGGQWFSLTYELLNEILNDNRLPAYTAELQEYCDNPDNDSHRQAIDEVYFQNFIVEFGYLSKYKFNLSLIQNDLRFVDWLARNRNADNTHPGLIQTNVYFSQRQLTRIISKNYLIVRKVDYKNKNCLEQLNLIKETYKHKIDNMDEQENLVSVCMCTRNRSRLMLPAIKCILQQTYKNIEFIIVDDCSDDDTEHVVKILKQQDNRVIYIKLQEHNFIKARNTAFRLAKGKYVCLIDSDDMCSPNKIEAQVKYLEEHPDIDVVGSKIKFGKKTAQLSIPRSKENWDHEYFENALMKDNENISMLLHFPAVMLRRSILDKVFPNGVYFYPEMKNGGEDQLFLYSLFINGAKFGNCADGTYLYNFLEYDDAISSSIGKHFDEDNFIFKYIHNKPIEDRLKITKELYNKYISNAES